jgi:hypothetical protein
MPIRRADLGALIADFDLMPQTLRKELRPALRNGAKPMLMAARRNARWSSRIPRNTKLTTKLSRSATAVTIAVNVRKVPHAPLYEGPRDFRHPLFGDREHWYTQVPRPFLGPAFQQHKETVVTEITRSVDDVLRRHGFA